MLIKASRFYASDGILTIIAMLNITPPFLRPKEEQQYAKEAHQAFQHQDGDHLTLLNLYHAFIAMSESPDVDINKWCRDNYVNIRSLRTAVSVRDQISRVMDKQGLIRISREWGHPDYYTAIRKAMITGYFAQVCMYDGMSKTYVPITETAQFVAIHPSCCIQYKPEWILFTEFVLTKKNFVRTVTSIRPEWLLEVCPDIYGGNLEKSELIKNSAARRVLERKFRGE